MDRLDALRAFVVTVDRGSLAAAARGLGRSPASITRAIASIEERLGAVVLRRTTRSVRLTEAGERYLAVARRVLADLDLAEKSAASAVTEPHGVLTVTAPLMFGSLHVRPIVDDYLTAHASVAVRLLLLDRLVNIVDEGVDVAVRIAHLPDSSLIATAVGSVQRVVVASPAYLAAHGRPQIPADLAKHRCVASTAVAPGDAWTFGTGHRSRARATSRARAVRIQVAPILSVNVADVAIRAALAGVGVTSALSYQVADPLASGALVRLLSRYELPPLPVHLVYPASAARAAKVRAFVDLATRRLRSALSLGAAGAAAAGA